VEYLDVQNYTNQGKASLENFCHSVILSQNIRFVGMKSIILECTLQNSSSDGIWRNAGTMISLTNIKAFNLFKLITDFRRFFNIYYFQWILWNPESVLWELMVHYFVFQVRVLNLSFVFSLFSSLQICVYLVNVFSLFSEYIIISYIS
jgi:hypothetical protein